MSTTRRDAGTACRGSTVPKIICLLAVPFLALASAEALSQPDADSRVQAAGNGVAAAEKAFFRAEGMFTDSYEALRSKGGLRADSSVCYGPIETYLVTRTGEEGFRFSVGRAGRDDFAAAYAFEGTDSGHGMSPTPNTFPCVQFRGAGKR
ncbi:MAG: hypothetical protein LBQ79_02185 [Deltaproteobacteria bacterium]|jgi:hypothetical protein|nr:hypothetical protein [Deltaproteobacteria bacterium]